MYVIPGFMWPSPFFMVVAVLLKQAFHRIASIMNKNQKVSSLVIQKTERYVIKMQKIWFINIYVFHEIRQIEKVYINIHSYVDILKKTSTRSRFKNNNSGSLHATHTLLGK